MWKKKKEDRQEIIYGKNYIRNVAKYIINNCDYTIDFWDLKNIICMTQIQVLLNTDGKHTFVDNKIEWYRYGVHIHDLDFLNGKMYGDIECEEQEIHYKDILNKQIVKYGSNKYNILQGINKFEICRDGVYNDIIDMQMLYKYFKREEVREETKKIKIKHIDGINHWENVATYIMEYCAKNDKFLNLMKLKCIFYFLDVRYLLETEGRQAFIDDELEIHGYGVGPKGILESILFHYWSNITTWMGGGDLRRFMRWNPSSNVKKKEIIDEILEATLSKDDYGMCDYIDSAPFMREEKYCKEMGQILDKNKIYRYWSKQ